MQALFSLAGVRAALTGWMLLLAGSQTMASLGGQPSVPAVAPAAITAATSKTLVAKAASPAAGYLRHEAVLENGTRIQEYATPAGIVFAVAWRGPVLPDLSVLLGSYFNAFKIDVEQARLLGRRGSPVNIEQPDLVLRSGGRMRNFSGYAYAPNLIPDGVSIQNVLQ